MTAVATGYCHVELDERGVPVIAGTRFKVALLIEQVQRTGGTPRRRTSNTPNLHWRKSTPRLPTTMITSLRSIVTLGARAMNTTRRAGELAPRRWERAWRSA